MLSFVLSLKSFLTAAPVSSSLSCLCFPFEIGDGHRCYRDLMERLIELDSSGKHMGQLTGAITLFGKMTAIKK